MLFLCRRPLPKLWRDLLLDLLAWGVAALLPIIAIFLIYDAAALVDQVIAFRGDLRAAIPGSWAETGDHFKLFVTTYWGFWLLAIAGIMVNEWAKRRGWRELAPLPPQRGELPAYPSPLWGGGGDLSPGILTRFTVIWLLSGAMMLLWHTPLFAHHFVVLLPPLILLAAGYIGVVVRLWQTGTGSLAGRIGLTAIIALAALNFPAMVEANQAAVSIVTGGREQEALKLLEAVTAPTDFVMGDSQQLIFMARRRTPPPLGDLALVGIKAGRQNSARLIALTDEYQSPAVVQWALRLPWLPEYLEWVDSHYLAHKVWDNDHLIHFVQRVPANRALPDAQFTRLGDSLALRGFEVQPGHADGNLTVKLYWQTDTALDKDYTVFTQLLNSTGQLVAGQDGQPLGGYFPTSQWPPAEIITDLVRLPLPPDLPAGRYTLITGMYRLDTMERLLVNGGPADFITLTTVELEH